MDQTSEEIPARGVKETQILAAARSLFLERGFAGASTDAIAKEANVSKETLYRYFSGKEELLAEVLRTLIGENLLGDGAQSFASPVFPETRDELHEELHRLAGGLIHALMQPEYLALVRVITSETSRFPQLGGLFRQAVAGRALENVRALLEQANERGIARVDDTESAARLFVGGLLTYAILDGLLISEGPPRVPSGERIAALIETYIKAIG